MVRWASIFVVRSVMLYYYFRVKSLSQNKSKVLVYREKLSYSNAYGKSLVDTFEEVLGEEQREDELLPSDEGGEEDLQKEVGETLV